MPTTIDPTLLDDVTGGGEGLFGAMRVGLVGLSLASGNPQLQPPQVEPFRLEQTQPSIKPPGQR